MTQDQSILGILRSTPEDECTIQVRRNNGQCSYGPWLAATNQDVPEWVADMICDEIAENDAEDGTVQQGGSIWTWRKVP